MNRFDLRLRKLVGDHYDPTAAEVLQARIAARWRSMIDGVEDRSAMMEFDRHRENSSGSRAGSIYERIWKSAFERECGFRMERDAAGMPQKIAVDVDALPSDVEFVRALVDEASAWLAASRHGRARCEACDATILRNRGAFKVT